MSAPNVCGGGASDSSAVTAAAKTAKLSFISDMVGRFDEWAQSLRELMDR